MLFNNIPQSAIVSAFLAGLVGGMHCVAMCGGYVAALSRPTQDGQPVLSISAIRQRHLLANAGRVVTYAALGLLVGAAGGAALAASWGMAERVLYVLANLLLLVLAVSVARGGSTFAGLERAGLAAFSRLIPAVARLGREHGAAARFALGVLWGLTPCGLVYGVLPVAMMSGGALEGGLVMLAFGLGTLPNLLAAGWLVGRAGRVIDARVARVVAAILIAAFALFGLWRAIAMPATSAHGPFCIAP